MVSTKVLDRFGEVDAVTIAPDGPLSFVSFGALPGRRPGTYALEDYPINYVNSGRWLYDQLQNPKSAPGQDFWFVVISSIRESCRVKRQFPQGRRIASH